MSAKKNTPIDFEKSLTELEKIVISMEKGSLTLEESLQYFERGVKLVKQCQNALKTAEQKVQILTGKGEEAKLQKFVDENEPDSDTESDMEFENLDNTGSSSSTDDEI